MIIYVYYQFISTYKCSITSITVCLLTIEVCQTVCAFLPFIDKFVLQSFKWILLNVISNRRAKCTILIQDCLHRESFNHLTIGLFVEF